VNYYNKITKKYDCVEVCPYNEVVNVRFSGILDGDGKEKEKRCIPISEDMTVPMEGYNQNIYAD